MHWKKRYFRRHMPQCRLHSLQSVTSQLAFISLGYSRRFEQTRHRMYVVVVVVFCFFLFSIKSSSISIYFDEYFWFLSVDNVRLNLPVLMKQKEAAVKGLTFGVSYLFKSNKVTHLQGFGSIKSPNEIVVTKNDNTQEVVRTKNILIATGSEVTPFPGIEVLLLLFFFSNL